MIYFVDGSWVQIGIISFGASPCESLIPNGFTRVQSYLNWVTSITGISYTTTQRPTTLVPDTTTSFSCQNEKDGNKANPSDCNTFYMCSNGTPYLFVRIIYSNHAFSIYCCLISNAELSGWIGF